MRRSLAHVAIAAVVDEALVHGAHEAQGVGGIEVKVRTTRPLEAGALVIPRHDEQVFETAQLHRVELALHHVARTVLARVVDDRGNPFARETSRHGRRTDGRVAARAIGDRDGMHEAGFPDGLHLEVIGLLVGLEGATPRNHLAGDDELTVFQRLSEHVSHGDPPPQPCPEVYQQALTPDRGRRKTDVPEMPRGPPSCHFDRSGREAAEWRNLSRC